MSTTLPLFWHLSSANKADRINASVKLVSSLEHFQSQRKLTNGNHSSESEDDVLTDQPSSAAQRLESENAADVSYSVKRLIRGLASSRESSRLGFAVVLTELISRLETVTAQQITELVVDASATTASMTGEEERDNLFARLFGITSIIQSNIWHRDSSMEAYTTIITLLVTLGEKKSWIRESVWSSIILAIQSLEQLEQEWKDAALHFTFETLLVTYKPWTPEKLAVAVILQPLLPTADWTQIMGGVLRNPNVLASANLQALAKILKEANIDSEEPTKPSTSTGNWKPQVHMAWDIIITRLALEPVDSASPQEFYKVCVDESLFANSSSVERKYWGFQVFQIALSKVSSKSVPYLFTKNFMRTWINHLRENDRYLHKVSLQIAKDIQAFVQTRPSLGFTLILQLTGANGSRAFDKLTKTKTVEGILSGMNQEGIQQYMDWLLTDVNASDADVTNHRSWVMDQLLALIHNNAIPKDDAWIQTILDWFIVHGLFTVRKRRKDTKFLAASTKPEPEYTPDLKRKSRTCLFSALADLTTQTTIVSSSDSTRSQKLVGCSQSGQMWTSRTLATVQELQLDQKHLTPLWETSEKDKLLVERATGLIKDLPETDESRGAELLLSSMLLSICNVDETNKSQSLKDSIDAVTELLKKPQSKSSKKLPETDADEIEPVDILVDVIIGYLEKSTAYLRAVANQTFGLLTKSVKETTIDLVLSQLERRDPAELAEETSDEDMDDSEADSEDSEGVSDDEDEAGSDGAEVSDDDDDSDSEDEEAGEEELEALRSKLEVALGSQSIEEGTDALDNDEEDMDDEQMMAIDETLAQVFKSQSNLSKAKNVNAQREATHFKNRVLDLIDIFVKKSPDNPLILRIVVPLVDLASGTTSEERQLYEKLSSILRNRLGKSKDSISGAEAEVVTTLEELHVRARRAKTSDILKTISSVSIYLLKGISSNGEANQALSIYAATLNDFITRKASPLNTAFFQDVVKRNPTFGWSLRLELVAVLPKAINVYRGCQIFEILNGLFTQLAAVEIQEEELVEFVNVFGNALAQFVRNSCDGSLDVSAAHLKETLKCGLAAARQTKKLLKADQAFSKAWAPISFQEVADLIAQNERYKASAPLKSMSKQMVDVLSSSAVVTNGVAQPSSSNKRATNGDAEVKPVKKSKRAKLTQS